MPAEGVKLCPAKDLLTLTLDDLEVPSKAGETKAALINRLNLFLIEQLRSNTTVVLLVDEAQNLTTSVLEEVRMLSNLETETEKLIQIVLMGQPELRAKLWLKTLTQLRQRVNLHYHLSALDLEETAAYVQHRLQVAGANSVPVFEASVLPIIFEHTQGLPRLINALCDRALLTGYVNEAKTIGPSIIEEVVQELPALIEEPITA